MLDHLIDPLGWKQPSVPALMSGLTTTPPTRPLPTRTRRRRRRILGRRKRGVPRTPVQPPLKLGHPSLESLVRPDQLAHPQQQRDSRLAIAIKDRLRLCPLHHRRIRRTDAGLSRGGERLQDDFLDESYRDVASVTTRHAAAQESNRPSRGLHGRTVLKTSGSC